MYNVHVYKIFIVYIFYMVDSPFQKANSRLFQYVFKTFNILKNIKRDVPTWMMSEENFVHALVCV